MAAKKTPERRVIRASVKTLSRATAKPAAAKRAPAKKSRPQRRPRLDPAQVAVTYDKLRARHSDAHCELNHKSAFQLILATVLSAQSTDVMVNKITPELFERWPTPMALANSEPSQVELVLSKVGMYRQKTRNVIGLCQRLLTEHGGEVPRTLDELIRLPGVGRKTANVVLGVAFGTPEGVVVDTHVQRISQRLGWTKQREPADIERDLMALFPARDWDMLSHTLIFHGRRICAARKPACAACPVNAECPSAFRAENVGRKAATNRARP